MNTDPSNMYGSARPGGGCAATTTKAAASIAQSALWTHTSRRIMGRSLSQAASWRTASLAARTAAAASRPANQPRTALIICPPLRPCRHRGRPQARAKWGQSAICTGRPSGRDWRSGAVAGRRDGGNGTGGTGLRRVPASAGQPSRACAGRSRRARGRRARERRGVRPPWISGGWDVNVAAVASRSGRKGLRSAGTLCFALCGGCARVAGSGRSCAYSAASRWSVLRHLRSQRELWCS